jgi:chromosomal replication initiator protein
VAKDDMEIVSAVREALIDKVGRQKFELWFADATLALEGGALLVQSPNEFKQEVLRANFGREIRAVVAAFAPQSTVEFRIVRPSQQPVQAPLAANSSEPAGEQLVAAVAPRAVDHLARPAVRRAGCFRTFVVGESNRMAFSTAHAVAQGEAACTSLLLYGASGVGKTHLLEATCHAARTNSPRRTVMVTAEQFTTHFVEAVRGSGLPNFRRKYRGVDLLAVDDIQFFAGKRATLVELLYTVDALLAEGRQIVMAADRAPSELKALGPEVVTRLAGGMLCPLQAPNFETRCELVREFASRMQLDAPAEVVSLVARRVTATAREIQGALHRLHAVTRIWGRALSREVAEQALGDLFADYGSTLRLSDIYRAVSDLFHLEPETLQSDSKTRQASQPRMLAMWLARKHTRSGLAEIGRFFGNRTHATVISAQKAVDRWIANEERVAVADQTWQIDHAIRRLEERLKVG